ncbi:hypothetical protein BDW72DRAFT_186652 [Aspergillus terricola var. indicus]
MRPSRRDVFVIVIICALPLEQRLSNNSSTKPTTGSANLTRNSLVTIMHTIMEVRC